MPAKKEKGRAHVAIWRQRGCDSEAIVALCLVQLGGNGV